MSDQQNERRLFTAAENGDYEQLHTLLKEFKDIDINIGDRTDLGRTILHKACRYSRDGGNYLQVVELLLAHGADVNSKDMWAEPPLNMACDNKKKGLNIIKLLINNNAEINWKDRFGKTPLPNACRNGKVDVVPLLIKNNAEINIKDTMGETPLSNACLYGHIDIVQLLIDNNADVNSKTNNGWTPLSYACYSGHTDIVKLLLRNGADMSIRTRYYGTAEDTARLFRRDEIVEFLQHYMEMRRRSFSWLKRRRQKVSKLCLI